MQQSVFRRLWSLAPGLCLVVLTTVAFSDTLANQFVNWDDPDNFLNNYFYRGLHWDNIAWAWTTYHQGAYQPLAWMLFSVEHAVWGLDPRGYHAVNLVLHLATVTALYALSITILRLCRWTENREVHVALGCGLGVGFYAIHPLRVETVSWISCQPYLACALFFVLAVQAYLHAATASAKRRWLNISLLLYALSLLSKSAAVSLPAVLVVLDVYPLRRLGGDQGKWFGRAVRSIWLEKMPFVALSVVFSLLAWLAKASTFNGLIAARGGLSRLAISTYVTGFYLLKTFVPTGLGPYYRFPGPSTWVPFFAVSGAVLVLTVGLFLTRRRWPGATAAWTASLIILAPVSSLVSISTQLIADRYTYFVAMAWAVLAAGGLTWLITRFRRGMIVITTATALAILTSLTLATRQLTRTWHDSESLWRHALTHPSGRTMMAFNNLAVVYFDRGQIDQGIRLCRTALTMPLDPADLNGRVLIHSNLANYLEQQGHFDDAIVQLEQLSHLVRLSAEVHSQLARLLAAQGRVDDAIRHYTEALRLDPEDVEARHGLERAVERRRRPL